MVTRCFSDAEYIRLILHCQILLLTRFSIVKRLLFYEPFLGKGHTHQMEALLLGLEALECSAAIWRLRCFCFDVDWVCDYLVSVKKGSCCLMTL
jgi:hypothetical protein